MSEQTKPTEARRGNGHLVVYLAWPILAGLALAVVLSVSVGGIVLLATRFDLRTAGLALGVTFFIVLAVATVGVFWYAAHEFAGPRSNERIEITRQTVEVIEPELQEPEVRFVPVRARGNLSAPALPSGVNRSGIRAAMTHLVDGLTKTAGVTEVAQEAESLEPAAPQWVREIYTVLCAAWPDKLTRRDFQALWPNGGTRLWRKYVNGDGSGRHVGRGILDTWGVIAKKDGRGKWRFVQSLDVIMSLDRELHTYAQAMAERVQHSPDRRLVLENAKKPVPNRSNQKSRYQTQTGGMSGQADSGGIGGER